MRLEQEVFELVEQNAALGQGNYFPLIAKYIGGATLKQLVKLAPKAKALGGGAGAGANAIASSLLASTSQLGHSPGAAASAARGARHL